MKCSRFQRRYSLWIDNRKSLPLEGAMLLHRMTCRECAGFAASMQHLEEIFGGASAAREAASLREAPEAALRMVDAVIAECRRPVATAGVAGYALRLAGVAVPGILLALLALNGGERGRALAETSLALVGLLVLGVEACSRRPGDAPRAARPTPRRRDAS
jgi:hypothetical protein